MLPFKPVTVADREIITAYTYPSLFLNCDFSFANMCSWRFLYNSEFTVQNDFLLIRFDFEEKERKRKVYMFPVGNGDLRQAIGLLEKDSEAEGHPLCMLGITSDCKNKLETLFPDEFRYFSERDYFDYIYLRSDLQTLKGKKFQAKRNHINKFKNQYPYTYLSITPDLVPLCLELEYKWYQANRAEREDVQDLKFENRSMVFLVIDRSTTVISQGINLRNGFFFSGIAEMKCRNQFISSRITFAILTIISSNIWPRRFSLQNS
ncbi:MAG: phosphatidylglycerol lysyltransferase domain-containing protein [Tannerella sp.]|jgi:hypothetical protein|nr:phosphatidylglycerol lysyltransferase domain-containing protein [Tannerella sp.]